MKSIVVFSQPQNRYLFSLHCQHHSLLFCFYTSRESLQNAGNLQLSTAPECLLPWSFHVDGQSLPLTICSFMSLFPVWHPVFYSEALSGAKTSVRREESHSLNVNLPPCPTFPTFPNHFPHSHQSTLPLSTSAVLYCEMDRQMVVSLALLHIYIYIFFGGRMDQANGILKTK